MTSGKLILTSRAGYVLESLQFTMNYSHSKTQTANELSTSSRGLISTSFGLEVSDKGLDLIELV